MSKINNIINKKYGRLLVLSRFGTNTNGKATWNCLCDCGVVCIVAGTQMRIGATTSCGCYIKEKIKKGLNRSHSLVNTPEYWVLIHVIERCYKTYSSCYKNYGARGIGVCERWKQKNGIVNFMEDMGKRPTPKHQIDRIDNDGDYEPSNCRWATKIQQANNTRTNRFLKFNGEKKTIANWARFFDVKQYMIHNKLKRGWSTNKTLRYFSRNKES